MSPAESVKLVILRNVSGGLMVSDVVKFDDRGRRRPVVFTKVGQVLDLNTVDLEQYAVSITRGVFKDLLRLGVVVGIQQELSEKKTDEYNTAMAKAAAPTTAYRKVASDSGQVVQLEPGLMVAVGDGTMSPQSGVTSMAPVAALEPGMAVATGQGPATTITADTKKIEDPQGGVGEQAPAAQAGVTLTDLEPGEPMVGAPDVELGPLSEPVADWKKDLTLSQQEDFINSSKDKKFLQSLIDDPTEESSRLKNLAKKRLAALAQG
jgi:hypothetical protein